MILNDIRYRLRFMVTGERPAPRTTSEERAQAFREMVRAGMKADDALGAISHLTADEWIVDPPPWA